MDLIRNWFKTISDNPQLTLLVILLVFVTLALMLTADILAPFLAAVVLAYLLQVFIDASSAMAFHHGCPSHWCSSCLCC